MDNCSVAQTIALIEELTEDGEPEGVRIPHVEDVLFILKTAERLADLVDDVLLEGDPSGLTGDAIAQAVASLRGRNPGRVN